MYNYVCRMKLGYQSFPLSDVFDRERIILCEFQHYCFGFLAPDFAEYFHD